MTDVEDHGSSPVEHAITFGLPTRMVDCPACETRRKSQVLHTPGDPATVVACLTCNTEHAA